MREDTDHIFFNCVLAKFVWACVKECLMWEKIPVSLDEFHQNWLDTRGANDYYICLSSFAAVAWTLWKIRNRMAIEKVFPNHLTEAIFKFISCLQKWRILIREDDRRRLDKVINMMEDWMKSFCALHAG